jgi:tetratricopeptide (TPR) repeat protein
MGRRGYSLGGGTGKSSKRELSRYVPKGRTEQRVEMTVDIMTDIMRAQALYDANDWDACEIVVRRLLKHKKFQQPLTFDALGSCVQFQGRIELALECFEKALAIDPTYLEAHNRIVMIKDALPTTTAEDAARNSSNEQDY